MADLATLTTRLTEAETAYHRLMTGSLEEMIGLGDMQVRYTRANMNLLAGYISQLRGDIAAAGGVAVTASGTRRAISVTL